MDFTVGICFLSISLFLSIFCEYRRVTFSGRGFTYLTCLISKHPLALPCQSGVIFALATIGAQPMTTMRHTTGTRPLKSWNGQSYRHANFAAIPENRIDNMNTTKILQQYILIKPNTLHTDGQFQALRSLENAPTLLHEPGQYITKNAISCQADSTSGTKRSKLSSMSRRNARERRRVKLINLGYETLRNHVPAGIENKKLSKVDTLRSAVDYIKHLQDLLEATDSDNGQIQNVSKCEVKQECPSPQTKTISSPVSSIVTSPSDSIHSSRLDTSITDQSLHQIDSKNIMKEEKVFIDIAEWLCRTSRSLQNGPLSFEGLES